MRISDWSSDVCSSDLAGCPVTVYVVPSAPAAKLAAIRSFGAELVFVEGAPLDAELEARRQAKVQGKAYVAPYNDIETMAGQGTLGMELARQAPDLDRSEEHTSELQSLMRTSYAVFCLKKKTNKSPDITSKIDSHIPTRTHTRTKI